MGRPLLLSVLLVVGCSHASSRSQTEYPKGWDELPPVVVAKKAEPEPSQPDPPHKSPSSESPKCAPAREKLASLRKDLDDETKAREDWMRHHCKLESNTHLGAAHWVCDRKHFADARDDIETREERRLINAIDSKMSWIGTCCDGRDVVSRPLLEGCGF